MSIRFLSQVYKNIDGKNKIMDNFSKSNQKLEKNMFLTNYDPLESL